MVVPPGLGGERHRSPKHLRLQRLLLPHCLASLVRCRGQLLLLLEHLEHCEDVAIVDLWLLRRAVRSAPSPHHPSATKSDLCPKTIVLVGSRVPPICAEAVVVVASEIVEAARDGMGLGFCGDRSGRGADWIYCIRSGSGGGDNGVGVGALGVGVGDG